MHVLNEAKPLKLSWKPPVVMRVQCEVYSRIVGYLRPTEWWNDGKRQEFEERVGFKVLQGDEDNGD